MVTLTYQERFRTAKGVFDAFVNRILFDMQTRGVFDELLSPLFIGKESNVFIASRGDDQIIVKIYRLQNCDFKKMYDYIRIDKRYESLKRNRRQIIFAWTKREFTNLIKAYNAGVRVPEVITFKHNVLIEEMIGSDTPALRLKDCELSNPKELFEEVVAQMKLLYQKANLVHGDLSEFNILYNEEKPVFIDFSQSTLISSQNSKMLLQRDIRNIVRFAKKHGILLNEEKVYKEITGI